MTQKYPLSFYCVLVTLCYGTLLTQHETPLLLIAEIAHETPQAEIKLSVPDNLSLQDSKNSNIGNIVKNSQRFIHNYGTNNTFVGIRAGNFKTQGAGGNSAFGTFSLRNNNRGADNTAVGFNTLNANTDGNENTAIGRGALRSNTVGGNNVAVGKFALSSNNSGNSNVAIGSQAQLATTTANNNVAIGYAAMQHSTRGDDNVAVGNNALQNNNGIGNTVIGKNAMMLQKSGNNSIAIGADSLAALQDGADNIALGTAAGSSLLNGKNNIFIGNKAGVNLRSGSNNTYIQHTGVASESNTLRIGSDETNIRMCFIHGIYNTPVDRPGESLPVYISDTAQLGTKVASRSFKKNITDINDESKRIFDINPVLFIDDTNQLKGQYGLILEEVAYLMPELVRQTLDGTPIDIDHDSLSVLLLNEMKKKHVQIAQLKKIVSELENLIHELIKQ